MSPRPLSLAELTERHRGEIVGYLARLLCRHARRQRGRRTRQCLPGAQEAARGARTRCTMTRHDDELIALLLGDRRRSPALARWLGTLEGRRELRAYRRTLDALQQLYGDAGAVPRRIIYYCAIPTPIGRVFVAATEAGLVRVSFRQSEASFVAELRQRLGHDVVRSPARTADIVHQLRAYFAGGRRRFDARLHPRHTTPFPRRVLMAPPRVPPGQGGSYREIARPIRQPRG